VEALLKRLPWLALAAATIGVAVMVAKSASAAPDLSGMTGAAGVVAGYMLTGTRVDQLVPQLAAAACEVFGDDTMTGPTGRDLAHALVGIANNELPARWSGGVVVGDIALSGGPSVGPLQVYRSTAKSLHLWSAPTDGTDEASAYALEASDVGTCLTWGCIVFESKLDAAAGNIPEAIRRYNGSGPKAVAYQQHALAFIATHWPSNELPLPEESQP
jgi:hypothetical protein